MKLLSIPSKTERRAESQALHTIGLGLILGKGVVDLYQSDTPAFAHIRLFPIPIDTISMPVPCSIFDRQRLLRYIHVQLATDRNAIS